MIVVSTLLHSFQGVFNKDTGTSKAREHALLISNRPAYVTILSLVRDAVARLPNGEGTRAEVCIWEEVFIIRMKFIRVLISESLKFKNNLTTMQD